MSNEIPHPPSLSAAELRRIYRHLFSKDKPKPLKVGIHHDILAAHPGQVSRKTLCALIEAQTRTMTYYETIAKGGPRYGLDGNIAGEINEREIALAQQRIVELKDQLLADQMLRKSRSATLKAYEASNLSYGEFAKQNGLSISELNSTLHKAQSEREARHQERLTLITKFEESGLTPELYSRRHNVPLGRLRRAAEKLGKTI